MKIKKTILASNVLIILVVVFMFVLKKEMLLSKGDIALFRLAPVDPRSIMQGDYMVLRYDITRGQKTDGIPPRGYIVFETDKNNVAKRIRFQRKRKPLNKNEKVIKYYCHRWDVSIGSESFFFQEGHGEIYATAKYGGIKIAANGESILAGLYNENLKEIR